MARPTSKAVTKKEAGASANGRSSSLIAQSQYGTKAMPNASTAPIHLVISFMQSPCLAWNSPPEHCSFFWRCKELQHSVKQLSLPSTELRLGDALE